MRQPDAPTERGRGINEDCIPGIQILRHLERVNLERVNLDYDEYDCHVDPRPIDSLEFLATMPSLKSLNGRFIAAYGDLHDFSCFSPQSSNIAELRFKMCNLSLEVLKGFFQGLKALQTFCYIYPVYYKGYDMALWDPAGMCELLSKYAQKSLEALDLRSDLEPVEPIESLHNFDILKELTLSFSLFRKGEFLSSETLASPLPKSIQKIGLHDVKIKHIWFLESTIRQVVHLKLARLPRLKQLCFFGSWDPEMLGPVTEELWKLCEDMGFELCFFEQE